ncbi:hypothetical protein BDR05DRAFT_998669 [Suillus weaverae]|nr:hypothetical protein BDR05DRAFT_998669 [Suillus weaverae]
MSVIGMGPSIRRWYRASSLYHGVLCIDREWRLQRWYVVFWDLFVAYAWNLHVRPDLFGSQGSTASRSYLLIVLHVLLEKNGLQRDWKGAHVSTVARTQSKLDEALKELEVRVFIHQSPDQIFKAFSFSLDTTEESAAALQAASDAHGGHIPDALFTCAGTAKPMSLLEMQSEDLTHGMTNGYWIQAWTAFAAAKQMVRENKKGKIILEALMHVKIWDVVVTSRDFRTGRGLGHADQPACSGANR